jgi:hypothetical protein
MKQLNEQFARNKPAARFRAWHLEELFRRAFFDDTTSMHQDDGV